MKSMSLVAGVLALLIAGPALAWKYYPGTPISEVWQWQDNGPLVFKTSGDYCYVPAGEKNLIAMVLSMYANQRPISIHCSAGEDTTSYGGLKSYRLHRIVAH